jgi:DNA-binding SARP family transcriptional activator/ABC-type glycerol-3-phosphate transport system substrate-binding protein
MEFRVLGPMEARRDGELLALGSFKQRSLLALLLINANEAVSADRIIDELWTDEAVADRHNALWVQVSKLRSTLEPGRERRSEGSVLLTRPPGYVLCVDRGALDAIRFQELVLEGRTLIDSDPAAASLVLGESLALWRGRPYEDFLYESFAQPEITRLDALRLDAVEQRLEADLRRGLGAEVVGELQGLVREHPLREQFTAQLMVALYRSGRQAEALRAYGQLRSYLAEELGLDPSPALQRLETQIICGDATLDRSASSGSSARLAVRGYELREQIGTDSLGTIYRAYQPTVGREVAVTVIRPALSNDAAFIRRFEADAETVAKLEHPHILPVHDFWREPEGAYLVTDVLRGTTFEDALRAGSLDAKSAVTIGRDVASALVLAHGCGVVHGRIEPRNVLVDPDGRGVLTGFGIGSPERLTGNVPTAASDLFDLGVVLGCSIRLDAADEDSRTNGVLSESLAALVDRATAPDPRDRFPDAASFADALAAAIDTSAQPVSTDLPNPYKGLHAFAEVDAADFFGRERLVGRLLARLGSTGTAGRFVAVVGPSGSGKSSAVCAGLLPAIRASALAGSSSWFVVQMTPGRHPYEELAAALRSIAVDPPANLLERLGDGVAGLTRATRSVLPEDHAQLLLVIDQFEEIFTLTEPATCRLFLDALAEAVEDRQSRLRVVVTLRADFYDRPLRHRDLGRLLRHGTELVTVMSPEELRRAIEGPAERVAVSFEPGLVAQMVADVADHPAALPLLQYALTELFERRRGRTIELSSYQDLGGAAGALVHRAEDVYREFDVPARESTRQVMLRLVNVGDGDGDDVTRRRVLRQELLGLGDDRVAIVLDTLARHRLLGFDRDAATRAPTVEIAHEALFVEWARLRAWIAECRHDVRRHRRLADAAEEWMAEGQAPDYLLRGARLDELTSFSATSEVRLTPPEHEFLDASVRQREIERALAQAQKDREAHLRRAGRRRTVILSAAVILAVATAFIVVTVVRHSGARASPREEASRLAAASTEASKQDPQLAMLLALQSLAISADADQPAAADAELALQWAVQAAGITYPVPEAPAEVHNGPNGATGTFRLPLGDVVDLVRSNLTRAFSADECAQYALDPCPSAASGLASPASTGPAQVPASAPVADVSEVDRPLSGTRVTVLSTGNRLALEDEFRVFEEDTGIVVDYVNRWPPAEAVAAVRPDIVISDIPGVLRDDLDGRLVDLSTYLDPAAVAAQVGDTFLKNTAPGASGIPWVPLYADLKGLVWYPPLAFAEAGYEIPKSLDELTALTRRMRADGGKPWCAVPDHVFPWMATDWLEALLLRVGGADLYDRWTAHRVPFDHPAVRRAGAVFDELLGADMVPNTDLGRGITRHVLDPMLDEHPGCWMSFEPDESADTLPADARLGENIDYFVLPPVDGAFDPPVLLDGLMAAARTDRPEVRDLMRHMVDPRGGWGTAGGKATRGSFIPWRAELEGVACADPTGSTSVQANGVRVRYCQDVGAALASGNWRLEASVLMPGSIGTFDPSDRLGAFPRGMVEYLDQGAEGLDGILAEIDDAWP